MLELLFDNMPFVLLAAGLVLMALEAASPGAHFIVVGVALVGAGAIGLLFPPAAAPLVLAVLALVFGVGAAWVYREFDFYGGTGQAQTSDSSSLPGRTGYVTEPVTTRSGEVKLEDGGFNPYYSARTTADVGEIEDGEEVIVLDPGGGNVLTVVPFGALEEDEIDRALAREAAESEESATADDGGATDRTTEESAEDRATETESERS